jgi:charged multivesicular body protein 7
MSELLAFLVENEPSFRRARLPALYSDFSAQRTLNPDGFAANLSAWTRGLSAAALAGQVPSRSSPRRNHFAIELDDTLLKSLESKQFGRPMSLGTVLQDVAAKGDFMPLQTFLKSTGSVIKREGSWSVAGIPFAVLKWGLQQAGLMGTGTSNNGKMPKGVFVLLANLEDGAQNFSKMTEHRTSRFERTFSKTHFRRTFEANLLPGQTLSETDFDVLIKYLSRDKGLIVTDGTTIKIRSSSSENTEDAQITEEDAAIGSLRELMEDLTLQTEALSARVDSLTVTAREAVGKKNRIAALGALKSKKIAEASLATRFATLGQLEEVAAKIEQASDNVALVRVMQTSTTALKSLNAKVGGAERVDEVLDELREQMGQVDEVGDIIAEAGQDAVIVDEGEVDDELEKMLAEEQSKQEEYESRKREAEEVKEAEATAKRLAELDQHKTTTEETDKASQVEDPPTPVTAAADHLGEMSLEKDPVRIPAE